MRVSGPATALLAERGAPIAGEPFAALSRALGVSGAATLDGRDSAGAWLAQLADTVLPPYDVSPAELLAAFDTTGGDVAARASLGIARATPASIPDGAASAIDHPRTRVFRRLAPHLSGNVGIMPYAELREAAQANAIGAIVAAARGDPDGARMRLGENSLVARATLEGHDLFSARFGTGMLQDLAVLPLAALELRAGNSARADSLRVAVELVREEAFGVQWDDGFTGLASDPSDLSRFFEAADNSMIPKGLRAAARSGLERGYCLNAREILSGADPARTLLLDAPTGANGRWSPTDQNSDSRVEGDTRVAEPPLWQRLSSCP